MTAATSVRTVKRSETTIYIGGVYASGEPIVIKTLLGSCVAVCLWDPQAQVGGMNHFMLPRSLTIKPDDPARFGVHAMDLLICAMMKAGAERHRLCAKVFGGAHVLAIPDVEAGVPRENIRFVREFLRADGLKVLSEDLGGTLARRLHFHTDSGRAFVKRVVSVPALDRLVAVERSVQSRRPDYGEVELF